MFVRNVATKNYINFFKHFTSTENSTFNSYQIRYCYPFLLNVNNNRKAYSNFTLVNEKKHRCIIHTSGSSQINVRFKSTDVKEVDSIKKESSNVGVDKQVVEPPALTRAEKLKKAVKEYGSTVIVFHVGISLVSLGACYLVVSSGLDTTKVFATLGLNDWLTKSEVAATAGTFAVAYAVHKVFAPIRIAITLTSVPFIVRYLRRIGFLKK